MFSISEGAERGIIVCPLTVTLGTDTWLEFEEISPSTFLKRVRAGETPTSSSPPPGLILKAFDTDDEVIHLAMADGLSGSYEVAVGLKPQAKHPENVHVINTRTLCTPHRVLALRAAELGKQGVETQEILTELNTMIDSAHSYLIPEDFEYLRRNGRLTPLAAKIVTLLKAIPVIKQTEDGTRLERFTVARKMDKALNSIISDMKKSGVTDNYHIGISHADNPKDAMFAQRKLQEAFPAARIEIFELGPAFITQGGPGCFAIQVIDISTCPDINIK